jgi:hypothetical protein
VKRKNCYLFFSYRKEKSKKGSKRGENERMKFDFFSKILFSKIKEKKRDRKIERGRGGRGLKFSELESWLENKQVEKNEETYKKAKPLIKKVLNELKEVRDLTLELKRKEIPEDIPRRARKVILTSKPAFVNGILESIGNLEEGDEKNVKKFQEHLQGSLDKIGKLLASKGRYLPIAFSEEMEKIGKKAKEILELNEDLQKIVISSDEDRNFNDSFIIYETIKEDLQKIKKLKEMREKDGEKLGEMRKENEVLKKKLDEIGESKEFEEFLEMEKKRDQLKEEREKIESELYNYLSPLKRPLKKFRKFTQDRGFSIKEINSWIKNPVEEFFSSSPADNNVKSLSNILMEIRNAINAKKLSLKNQEISRVEKVITEFNKLKKLREKYLEIGSREKEIKEKLEKCTIKQEKEDIAKEIESMEREIRILEKEMEKTKSRRSELEKEIAKMKEELEEKVGEIEGKKILISDL